MHSSKPAESSETHGTQLRSAVCLLNRSVKVVCQIGLERRIANPAGSNVMVLATTGSGSGERRLVSLDFADGGDAICDHSKRSPLMTVDD